MAIYASAILVALFSCASAFRAFPATKRSNACKVAMMEDVGALPPVGFFDPLGLSNGKSPEELKKWREAELKHGNDLLHQVTLGSH